MLNSISYSIFFILISQFSFAQSRDYRCTISRTTSKDVTITNYDLEYEYPEMSDYENFISWKAMDGTVSGKGKEKDVRGIKERHKLYFVDKQGDKIGAAYKNEVLIGSIASFEIVETDFGWQFVRDEKHVVCEVNLTWNHKIWHCHVKYFEQNKDTKELNKIVLASLTTLARRMFRSQDENIEDEPLLGIIVGSLLFGPSNWWESISY